MWRMIILSHNMACHDFDTFIDQELGTNGQGGCSLVPSARTGTAGLLCRLQGCFGIGMGNPSAGVFGLSYRPTRHKTRLIVLARPNVIRHLGYLFFYVYHNLQLLWREGDELLAKQQDLLNHYCFANNSSNGREPVY